MDAAQRQALLERVMTGGDADYCRSGGQTRRSSRAGFGAVFAGAVTVGEQADGQDFSDGI